MYIKEFSMIKQILYFRHYPQPKPTTVADNPEMQRMRLLTDIQSNVLENFCFEKFEWDFFFLRRNIMKILIKVKENLQLLLMIQQQHELKNNNVLLVKPNIQANEKIVHHK
jgi:hypothetical protein